MKTDRTNREIYEMLVALRDDLIVTQGRSEYDREHTAVNAENAAFFQGMGLGLEIAVIQLQAVIFAVCDHGDES